ncbi:DUF2490 domain-containing protein [Chitinophaga sp. Cy-1792]|uniref:DUF2490 domain-containing protein n=1 Tax=Chitinophaga sp. Cy-1792 TaxID=2608339 RepID=UPI00142066DE|nr:DUF2490 domain-containing protein [Chitinophaga sp. Cy-1792]NIG55134.1 DUF2490 domain-containing protein [Chitinophaga sp. Cy-1792]
MKHRFLWFLLLTAVPGLAQQKKEINNQLQSWISLNTTFRINDHWGFIGDAHMRRNNFVADNSFYFLRGGVGYWLNENLSFITGYGHLWLAPTTPGYTTFADENRWYEQIAYATRVGKVSLLNRFRSEQRWREQLQNDQSTGNYNFSNRFRYLISIGIPLSPKPFVPQISLANEVAVQFGKTIVNNTFDQFRAFAGIRQNMGSGWSFDFGYMFVSSQKASGYQYDYNHTIRLFFYYTWMKKKGKSAEPPALQYEDE